MGGHLGPARRDAPHHRRPPALHHQPPRPVPPDRAHGNAGPSVGREPRGQSSIGRVLTVQRHAPPRPADQAAVGEGVGIRVGQEHSEDRTAGARGRAWRCRGGSGNGFKERTRASVEGPIAAVRCGQRQANKPPLGVDKGGGGGVRNLQSAHTPGVDPWETTILDAIFWLRT